MRILIVTPAPAGSLKGNRITALRWAKLLRELGHRASIAERFDNQSCDVLIALHARRSAQSIKRFSNRYPNKPLILALTGTDLYGDIRHIGVAQESLQLATRLVALQPNAKDELNGRLKQKVRVIYQSVSPLKRSFRPKKGVFEVCVLGHLRAVKDPFRAAMAVRKLPKTSNIQIVHIGKALTHAMEERAQREMQRNSRYKWHGELSQARALQRLARSRLLALTSKMEGGANVISEAVTLGVPVVASRIAGSIGLLGEDYPGYFPVGDTQELSEMLSRAENDSSFYDSLHTHCQRLRPLFAPNAERQSWAKLLSEFSLS